MRAKLYLLSLSFCAAALQANAQWTRLTTQTYSDMDMKDIYASGSRIIAVGYTFPGFQGHVIISTDNGQNWDTMQPIEQGILFETIAFKDADTGFIGGMGSKTFMAWTYDKGLHWKPYMSDASNAGIHDMHFFDSKTGVASGYSNSQFYSGQFYRTNDYATTWTPIPPGQLGCLDTLPLDFMKFLDQKTGWGWSHEFGIGKTVMKTTDSGKSWTLQYKHTTSVKGVHFWNANNGILADGNGEIFKTTDGGQSWVKQTNKLPPGIYTSMAFINQTTGFIIGLNTIFKTTDGGQTWTKESNIPAATFSKVRFFDNRAYAVAKDGTIMRSEVITNNVNEVLPLNEQLNIYPNPANTELNISSYNGAYKNIEVAMQDMNGRTVLQGKTANALLQLNTAGIPAGVYTLQIKADDRTTSSKVSIAH